MPMSDIREFIGTTKDYRECDGISQSLLKKLDNYGPRHLDKDIKVEGEAVELGTYIDCMLLTNEEFEDTFALEPMQKPKNQLLELANAVLGKDIQISEIPSEEEKQLVLYIADELKLFGSTKVPEKRIATFDEPLFWDYILSYKQNKGKVILSLENKQKGDEGIEILKNHEKTKDLFFISGNKQAINQLKLVCTINGVKVKVMIDKVIIDHDLRTVTAYDLKCTEVRQINFPYWFEKMKYYLQTSLYNALLMLYVDKHLPGYTTERFCFIVYSTSDKFPFIWRVSDSMLQKGWFGFSKENGKYNKGVEQLISEYKYYTETGNFSIEKEFQINKELEIL